MTTTNTEMSWRQNKPGWRIMTHALIWWCILIAGWATIGAVKASHSCVNSTYIQACHAGTAIGVLLILVFGFLGFIVLALIWIMSKPGNH